MAIPSVSSPTRRGSGLVLAMMVLLSVGTMIYISTDSIVTLTRQVTQNGYEEQCKAAAEAVAARKEEDLVAMAANGDPNAFLTWSSTYGQQWFGNCQVKWRIEPFLVYDEGRNPTDNSIEAQAARTFIANYHPGDVPPTAPQAANQNLMHFRIATEAQYLDSDVAGQKTGTRAQAFRWAQINVQNLFKYALFYAQEGHAGDIELSHGPDFTVVGGVHSNGAIYIGGASNPYVKSNIDTGGNTYLGPKADGTPITITGIDGVFRQRKKTNYAFLGGAGYPDATTRTTPDPMLVSDTSLFMTQNNRYLNGTGTKALQTANDSHNATWKTDSLSRWGGWVRTRTTGATVVRTLSNIPELSGRPFEPQRLTTDVKLYSTNPTNLANTGAYTVDATAVGAVPLFYDRNPKLSLAAVPTTTVTAWPYTIDALRYWTDGTSSRTETMSQIITTVPQATAFMMNGLYVDYAMGTKETGGIAYTQFNTAAAPNRYAQVFVAGGGGLPQKVGMVLRELPAQSWPAGTDAKHTFTFTCSNGTVYTIKITTGVASVPAPVRTATVSTTSTAFVATGNMAAYVNTLPTGNPTLLTVEAYFQKLATYADYLRSQYQVFFGATDVSWAFFSYPYSDAGVQILPVSEDWIYNRRVYWTQGVYSAATLPKESIVTLNMSAMQDFLKTQSASLIDVAYPASDKVKQHFNGLIYLHRTNRADASKLNTRTFGDRWADPAHPELFTAAFRIARASDISWEHVTGTEPLGTSKTSIVTPNAMFLWGNINTVLHGPSGQTKPTPVAVMADSVTVLSPSWLDTAQQSTAILSSNTGPTGTDATYNCALVTNNWPVDPTDMYQNQNDDSSTHTFVGWLERGSRNFTYLGSVVVLNRRRYCWGYNQGTDRGGGVFPTDQSLPTTANVYDAPNRFITFNEDLQTSAGRPPYVLDGYNVARVASYVDVVR